MTEEGGYYAIKGFEYQIDKAILEILNSSDVKTPVYVEKIQDINSTDFVMQVKYKEKKEFIPSLIKKPVIQLLEEFNNNRSINYILYSHFGDLNGYDDFSNKNNKITLDKLNRILGNKKRDFNEDYKMKFVKKFILDFSPEFQVQFHDIIQRLKKESFIGDSDDEAIFYYSNISSYIKRFIISNAEKDIDNRVCTKKEILDYLNNGKKLLFNTSFLEYKGADKYFKFIRKKYFQWFNITDFERFFIIEISANTPLHLIKDTVISIKNKFYIKSGAATRKVIKSGAPYILLLHVKDNNLITLKQGLKNEGYIFKDGYDFYNAEFSENSIQEKSTVNNNICLKFINNQNDFMEIINSTPKKTREIYQFYLSRTIDLEGTDIMNVKIKINDISDIKKIIMG